MDPRSRSSPHHDPIQAPEQASKTVNRARPVRHALLRDLCRLQAQLGHSGAFPELRLSKRSRNEQLFQDLTLRVDRATGAVGHQAEAKLILRDPSGMEQRTDQRIGLRGAGGPRPRAVDDPACLDRPRGPARVRSAHLHLKPHATGIRLHTRDTT